MWAKIKAVAATIWADICNTYQRTKVFLLGFVVLLVYIEWEKIKTILLVKGAQKEISTDKKEDQTLAQKEATDNTQADVLVKEAQGLPSTETPVTDNWYEKDKK